MDFAGDQIERLRLLYEDMQQDQQVMEYFQQRDQRRIHVREQMLDLLNNFFAGEVRLEQLRETYDRQTRGEWDVFGLKGMSGAMFLNMLVKYIHDSGELADRLKQVLPAPESEAAGKEKMRDFYHYLESIIKSTKATKQQIQPARTPFFVSAWWHLQDLEKWPVFYTSGRQALGKVGIYTQTADPVVDYFRFREIYVSLQEKLNLESWQLEHLLRYRSERDMNVAEPVGPASVSVAEETQANGEEEEEEAGDFSHVQIQWLLATIGKKLGCKIWIAANDHNREWQGQRLGDLSLSSLPTLGVDPDSQKIISLIDVLWISGFNKVAAAFEIEHTTSIYSGILRMSDLLALSPNLVFPLYIVVAEKKMDKVRRELSRPTFQALDLHKQCSFFSYEDLHQNAEALMKWANDPSVISKLASRVDDVKS